MLDQLLASYAAPEGRFDELLAAPGRPRHAGAGEQLVVAIALGGVAGEQRGQHRRDGSTYCRGRRRSRVYGKSGFGASSRTAIAPGV